MTFYDWWNIYNSQLGPVEREVAERIWKAGRAEGVAAERERCASMPEPEKITKEAGVIPDSFIGCCDECFGHGYIQAWKDRSDAIRKGET